MLSGYNLPSPAPKIQNCPTYAGIDYGQSNVLLKASYIYLRRTSYIPSFSMPVIIIPPYRNKYSICYTSPSFPLKNVPPPMQVLPIGSLLLYAHSQPRLAPRRALHIPHSTMASWLAIALSSFRKLHLESEMRVTCSPLNCSRLS